ncbi:MAG: cation:dicarboxylase symporter family transporter, partial [Candidatus Zixiibacteriota bacterium]
MERKKSNIILIGMISGAVLGVLGGYFVSDVMIHIKFLGTIFLNALKMIVVPLIIASLIIGVTSLGDIRRLGRTAGKTLLYYIATTSFSVLIGIILVNLIRPGMGVPPIGAAVPEFVGGSGQKTVIDVIVGLVPDNIFGAAAEGQILPLIIFALIFGGVLTAIGAKGRPVISFFDGVNAAIMKIVTLIIYFAPIGIFALIGGIVAENRESVHELITALGIYAVTVIIGLIIHATIILPLILKLLGKKRPFEYFLNMGQALATAFTTASSSATLPMTMESVEEKNKVDSRAASFVLPLGATINMDGTALYEAVAAIFIAQIYGIDLSVGAQVIIFFTATLASIGAAAIPEAGLVMMSLVLTAVGLPLEGIGIILAIDWFLDRCRTTVNVWGDSIGAAVIGQTSEMRDYQRKTVTVRAQPPTQKRQAPEKARAGQDRTKRTSKTDRRTKPSPGQDGRKKVRRHDNGKGRPPKPQRSARSDRKDRGPRRDRLSRPSPGPDVSQRSRPPKEAPAEMPDREVPKGVKSLLAPDGDDRFFDKPFSEIDIFGNKEEKKKGSKPAVSWPRPADADETEPPPDRAEQEPAENESTEPDKTPEGNSQEEAPESSEETTESESDDDTGSWGR